MEPRIRVLSILLVAGLVLATGTGCERFWKTPTPTPTPPADVPTEVRAARDRALAYLQQKYPDRAPPAAITWTEKNTTPPGTSGVSSYEFTSENWLLTVWVPHVSPEHVVYELELDNQESGFHWTGKLNEAYVVLESNLNVAVEVLVVREIVLLYFREHYAAEAPGQDLVWVGERTTPEGSVGHEWCRFTADNWLMTVDYELARPDQVVYQVELRNTTTGLSWHCQVNAEGTVLEIQVLPRT